MSSSKSLQPIYVALDSQQYGRAIKLCLAQTSPISRALLAHAYAKSSQRGKALATINSLFGGLTSSSNAAFFPELQLHLQYALVLEESTLGSDLASGNSSNQVTAPQQQSSTSGKKAPATAAAGGKKLKKKPTPVAPKKGSNTAAAAAAPVPQSNTSSKADWDLVDLLDTSLELPVDWEQQLPAPNVVEPDGTLLATVSMTLTSVLHLPLTAYQLYCWALTCTMDHTRSNTDQQLPADQQQQQQQELFHQWTRKAFALGLAVQLAPQSYYTPQIRTAVLAHLQVLALQLARWQQQQQQQSPATTLYPATLWAAQTAVWQITLHPPSPSGNHNGAATAVDVKQQQRLAMLPRLAESFASKCVQEYSHQSNSSSSGTTDAPPDHSLLVTESFLLYMKTLDIQKKWTEKLAILDERLQSPQPSSQPPRQTLLELKLETLQQCCNDDDDNNSEHASNMRATIEELLRMFPDDWEYWQQLLQCCIMEADGDVEQGCAWTEELIQKTLQQQQQQQQQQRSSPLRAPNLMRVELAARQFCRNDAVSSSSNFETLLLQRIQEYGDAYAPRASCAFSDLRPYLRLVLNKEDTATLSSDTTAIRTLLDWSMQLRSQVPSSDDSRVRQQELRTYLFAVKVNFTVCHIDSPWRKEELPSWEELVTVWKDFQSFEVAKNVDQAQKESRPADELILLAVQRILCENQTVADKMTALCLLEAAIRYSPYNAYLKIAAMFVYSDLNAASRCWELYNDLYVKHIQNESCSYLVLPMLRSGGLYAETIRICQDILGLQRNAMRESADFCARCMENGAASKAEEIINFQRNRMTRSLTTLEAKGLTLELPSLLVAEDSGEIGVAHGIVGGDADVDRIKQMIAEAHTPSGAFTLLELTKSGTKNVDISENRDFGIMSFEVLGKRDFASIEQVLKDSMRRALVHNLLVRAALCVDASKAPRKGKLTKASNELVKRCKSLLLSAEAATNFVQCDEKTLGYEEFFESMLCMSYAIAGLSAGMNSNGDPVYDTLDAREEVVVQSLSKASSCLAVSYDQCGVLRKLTVSRASCLLPDCISPIFAIFQMCAKLVELYGWGRRKVKTKRCAAAVAQLSKAVASLIRGVKGCLDAMPDQIFAFDPERAHSVSRVLDADVVKAACAMVFESQQCTRRRLEPILDYIRKVLDSFDNDD